MNDSHYQQQGGPYEARARRDQYQQPYQQQQPVQQQQQERAPSPPTSASPFAFAPPPLSSIPVSSASRPPLSAHYSDPAGISQPHSYYQYQQKVAPQQPPPMHVSSYPYPTSASMGYRSYSGESEKHSPVQPHLTRTPSLSILPQTTSIPSQSSPVTASPFSYQQRQTPGAQYGTPSQPLSSPRAGAYPSPYYTTPYSQPTSADMPRSLSYPSNYSQPYPSYLPSMSAPSTIQQPGLPPLMRHNTMAAPTMGMDMRQGPSLGYSFANRLPLVDRPFKCDECVQSFNRNHDLKRHKRIHLSVKPFGCDKCGKTFSRKDALRRHWLVKGCRGEEGATAPITPMYPINSQPPALSPPTPPTNVSPVENSPPNGLPSSSFSHPSAPPPLGSMPPRNSSENSQIIVTPNDIGQQMARSVSDVGGVPPSLQEPLVLDTSMGGVQPSGRSNGSDGQGGYFEGVVGVKQDGTAVLDASQGNTSPYTRFPTSPSNGGLHHPYRRPSAMPSPGRAAVPASSIAMQPTGSRQFGAGTLGADGKPIFAMPFTPTTPTYAVSQQDGLLAPPLETSTKMEKQLSSDGAPETWQRWHRPSFPFPAPPGVNYNYDPSSPVDISAQAYSQ